ncbi:MAG: VWA domain-containing protein [Gammaproteobacteria bacterium]|nr:VWA domain-containing protein [Gammaproteobacteria bacterium]MXY58264.1 VWA domain-containing protein [Gammaproteobacteria bacterium]MYF28385.1 VWA domain-containing protein [Gammaproteobacteria bacterium]MYK46048.1 VWA domain-containing protein [Gammaproteobacteria bacterium]
MEGIVFANPNWVHVVWPAMALVVALAFLEFRGRDLLARFVSSTMQTRLAESASTARRVVKLVLIFATLLFGIAALMRPQTPGGTEAVAARRISADIMVVLDVSKSMLAEDAAPNRLARAKADVAEFVDRVTGHRVGLVAFAGRAAVMSPLTTDYGFFHLVLNSVDSASVSRGGTRIGDAIHKAVAAFGINRGVSRVMLLITDGEDHDSYPIDAVEEAVNAGVRIVAIGFGSETGSEITLTDPDTGAKTLLADRDGVVVRSRLDGELLRELALRTEGVYVPAGTSAIDLDAIVEAHIEPLVTDASARLQRRAPTEHYFWLVLGAIVCLGGAVWASAFRASSWESFRRRRMTA